MTATVLRVHWRLFWPNRVFKGMRMAGRMGNETVKTRNIKIAKIISEQNLILLNGSVPEAKVLM